MSTETVYGIHAVQALLKSAPQRIRELWVLQGRDDQRLQKITQQAQKQNIAVVVKPRKALDDACEGNIHQGVLAFAKPGRSYDESYLYQMLEELDRTPFLLILDGVTDPHNLGACLRSADAAGVQAVVVPKDNSAGLTEVARKVACGAADTVPLVPVTNLARTLKKLQDLGIWVVGAAGEATASIYESPLQGPLAVVMGAEGTGMRRLTRETCDYLAYIPMAGEVTSLNVSVATGVCLFEAVRQRQLPPATSTKNSR